MLIRKQIATLPLGSFADIGRVRRMVRVTDNEIDLAEAIRAYGCETSGGTPKDLTDLYEKLGGARYPLKVLPSPETRYGLGIDGGMCSKGTFFVPGIGYGVCLTRHQFNALDPAGPFHMLIAFRLDDMPATVLHNHVASVQARLAPKDFPLVAGEDVSGMAVVPLDILVEPERRFDHGTGGGYEREVKALVCAIDRTSLARLAGNSGGVSFYASVGFEDGRTFYINLDGVPGRNFLLVSDEELRGLGAA